MTGFSSGVRGASLGTANTWAAFQRFNAGLGINTALNGHEAFNVVPLSNLVGSASANTYCWRVPGGAALTFITTPQTGDATISNVGQVTINQPSAGTIAVATSLRVSGPPIAGTNCTITSALSFYIAGGTSRFGGPISMDDGCNFALGTSTGTKIGTATTQKLGFYNATPIVQPGAIAAYTNTGVYATDAANIKTAIDGLRAALTNLGLTA